MNTKERGDVAVGEAIRYFISQGYEVCLPIGDRRPFDFVVERNGRLDRVQVKFAGVYKNGKCVAGLRITGGNQSYNYAKKYTKDSFDVLFVYTGKGERYVFPWNKIDYRNALAVESRRYTRYKV